MQPKKIAFPCFGAGDRRWPLRPVIAADVVIQDFQFRPKPIHRRDDDHVGCERLYSLTLGAGFGQNGRCFPGLMLNPDRALMGDGFLYIPWNRLVLAVGYLS
jgi:hypothetical protein